MQDMLSSLNEKIEHLKKKRERVETQLALSFMKETQKIFKEYFSAELALTLMKESWGAIPETTRKTWKQRSSLQRPEDSKKIQREQKERPFLNSSFPLSASQPTRK